MAATSVLLLLPNQYPNELSPFFTEDNYRTTINIIKTTYNISRPTMAMDYITSVLSIIDNLIMESISRKYAVSKLLDMVVPAHQEKFNKAVLCLIMKLPMNPIGEEMNESELSTRYLEPFLSGLFEDPDHGIYFCWTNESTMEARKHQALWKNRPDSCITKLLGSKWHSSHGYGEIKLSSLGNRAG